MEKPFESEAAMLEWIRNRKPQWRVILHNAGQQFYKDFDTEKEMKAFAEEKKAEADLVEIVQPEELARDEAMLRGFSAPLNTILPKSKQAVRSNNNWQQRDFRNDPEAQAEIQRFKTNINLIEFAEKQYGFEVNLEKCSKRHVNGRYNVVMSNGRDHILVTQQRDSEEWVYTDAADIKARVGGDIFKLMEWQEGKRFGEAMKALRQYTGAPDYVPQTRLNLSKDSAPKKDLEKVHKAITNRKPVDTSEYLENTRLISRETFTHPLFKDRVLKGFNGVILFPHHNESGLVGYEYRGEKTKGFAKHGYKGLWFSQVPKVVEKVVFTESPIEALCHFECGQQPINTLYISAGGTWKESVSQLIKKVIQKYPGANIVAAYNNDKGGYDQTKELKTIAHSVDRTIDQTMPPEKGQDWNDLLKSLKQPEQSIKKNLSRTLTT